MFEYRLAHEEDFEQALGLFQQLWQNKAIDAQRLRSLFLRAITAPLRRYVLATEGQRIVGLASVSLQDKLWQEGLIAYVEELIVDEAYRGQGIGQGLLDRLTRFAKERNCVHLELDCGFPRLDSHRFYENYGFQKRAYLFSLPLS